MFYFVSKLFWLAVQPATLAMLLIVVSLWFARNRPALARGFAAAGLGLLALIFLTPAPKLLIYPLEQRFAGGQKPKPGDAIAGIIMLGGFEEDVLSRERGGLEVNSSAQRILEGLLLARRFPDAKVIFTGGSQNPAEHGGSAAVAQYLADSGIPPERLVIEPNSRTTFENARLLRPLLDPKPGARYVLVTSAFHMPRAVGVFRAAGFDVLPDPVDYHTTLHDGFWEPFAVPADGLRTADMALKEWFGLIGYRLSGRIHEFWPKP